MLRKEFQDTVIKVIGVGNGGSSIVAKMYKKGIEGVKFIAVSTDTKIMSGLNVPKKVQLGEGIIRRPKSGRELEMREQVMLEDELKIVEVLDGSDMVFITVCIDEETETETAQIIAKIAKDMGILTVGVVVMSFGFEGSKRQGYAEQVIKRLKKSADTLMLVPNQKLLTTVLKDENISNTFKSAANILCQAVKGVIEVIAIQGLIDLDFYDVKKVMCSGGYTLITTAKATGEDRALTAAKKAIDNPLFENVQIESASRMLVNVTGGADLTLNETYAAAELIKERAKIDDINFYFGIALDESLEDSIQVTVIAAGFDGKRELNR